MKDKHIESPVAALFSDFIKLHEMKFREKQKRCNMTDFIKTLSQISSLYASRDNLPHASLFIHLCNKHKGKRCKLSAKKAGEKLLGTYFKISRTE